MNYSDEDIEKLKTIVEQKGRCSGISCEECPLISGTFPHHICRSWINGRKNVLQEIKRILKGIKIEELLR